MNRTILIIGTVVVVAILAGAAFVGMQMLAESASTEASAAEGGGQRVMETVIDDGSGPVGVRITFEPAAELPKRPAEAAGIFVSRQDNSFMVGTGGIELDVEVDGATGQETIHANHTGPEVEVVVTHDTVLYKDVTEVEITDEGRQSGQQTIQQMVQPADSAAAIGENTELQVWGQKRGDRIVAEVLVYSELR